MADQGAPKHSTALEEVIYLISHDLMAPVRALRAIPEWIAEDLEDAGIDLPPDVAENFKLMEVQGSRLQAMIQDLLRYSRVGRNQHPFDGNWSPIKEQLAQLVPSDEGLTCSVDLAGHPLIGEDDATFLLTALVSNAVKHMGTPTGTIAVTGQTKGDEWYLTVSDTGPGIAPDDRDRAMQIFTTLRSRDAVEGSGMGLPTSVKACTINGGTLTIGAPPSGQGCEVTATLPCAAATTDHIPM